MGKKILATNISYLRKRMGLSQSQLGDMVKKKNSVISAYEKAVSKPPVDVLVSLSKIFSIHIEYLTETDLTDLKNQNLMENKEIEPVVNKQAILDMVEKTVNPFMIFHAVRDYLKETSPETIQLDDEISRFISKTFVINTIFNKWILKNPLLHHKIDSMSTENKEIDEDHIYTHLIEKIEETRENMNGRLPEITKDLKRINDLMSEFFSKNQDLKDLLKSALY